MSQPTFRLVQHIGIGFDGEEVRFAQWMLYADDLLIGYLPHAADSQVLPLPTWPWNLTEAAVAEFTRLRNELDPETPSTVVAPEEVNRKYIEALEDVLEKQEAIEDDDDE